MKGITSFERRWAIKRGESISPPPPKNVKYFEILSSQVLLSAGHKWEKQGVDHLTLSSVCV